MRKLALLAALLMVLPAALRAQDTSKAEIGFGYSMLRFSQERTTTHGFDIPIAGNINPNLAMVFDFAGHYGSVDETLGVEHFKVNVQDYSVMVGPRVSETAGKIWRPFAQALVGYHRTSLDFNNQFLNFTPDVNADTSSGVAVAVGGGIDVLASPRIAVRLIQLEYAFERRSDVGNHEEGARLGMGVIFMIGKKGH